VIGFLGRLGERVDAHTGDLFEQYREDFFSPASVDPLDRRMEHHLAPHASDELGHIVQRSFAGAPVSPLADGLAKGRHRSTAGF
jgi:hypothetical protein